MRAITNSCRTKGQKRKTTNLYSTSTKKSYYTGKRENNENCESLGTQKAVTTTKCHLPSTGSEELQ